MNRGSRLVMLQAVLAGAVLSAGCFVMFQRGEGEQLFTKAQVDKIQPGKTTKEEILQWFGPPLAIAKKGEMGDSVPGEKMRTSTFLELFSSKHAIGEHHVIYYYRNEGFRGTGAVVLLAGGGESRIVRDKLWVLINSRTGIVEDHVLRQEQ